MEKKKKSILNIPLPNKKLISNNTNKLQSNGLTLNNINSQSVTKQICNSKSVSNSLNLNVPKIKDSQSRNNNSSCKANKSSYAKTNSNSLRSLDTVSKNIHSMKSSISFKNIQNKQDSKEHTNKLKNLIFSPSFNKVVDRTMSDILIKSKETNNISIYSENSENNNITNVNGMIISNFITSINKIDENSDKAIIEQENALLSSKAINEKDKNIPMACKVDGIIDERINNHRFYNNKKTNSIHESTFSLIEDNISSEIYLRNRSKSKDNTEIVEENQKDENLTIKINKKQVNTKNNTRRCNKLGVINEEEEPMSIKNSQRNLFPFESDKISPFNIRLVNNNLNRLKNEYKSDNTSITDDIQLSSTDGMTERNSNQDTITITNLSEFDNDNKVINSLKKPKEILICRKGRGSNASIRPFEPIAKISNKNIKMNKEEDTKCNIF